MGEGRMTGEGKEAGRVWCQETGAAGERQLQEQVVKVLESQQEAAGGGLGQARGVITERIGSRL